jgi:hypothetical protein
MPRQCERGVVFGLSHGHERDSHNVFRCNAAQVLGGYGEWRVCHVSESCPERFKFRIGKGRDDAKSRATLVVKLLPWYLLAH